MTELNLSEKYSNYYIRLWKKQGLRLIKERPATTTEEIFEEFIKNKPQGETRENKNRRISKLITHAQKTKLDWKKFIREV